MALSAAALLGLVTVLNATFPYSPSAPRDVTSLTNFVQTLRKNFEVNHGTFGGADGLPGFLCHKEESPPQKRAVPTDVTRVTIPDLEVVAAMGDSLSCGFGAGATSIFSGVLTEYKGLAFSIGGDQNVDTVVTTYNIQKDVYNNGAVGGATGTGNNNPELDVAVSGAVSLDMPGQADVLISRLRSFHGVDVSQKWKIVTLFVGGNDLCDWCNNKQRYTVEAYKEAIRGAVRKLMAGTNNTIVNLVPTIDVTQLHVISSGLCSFLHSYECSCAVQSASVRAEVSAMASAYHVAANDLEVEEEFRTRRDFALVVQPFMTNTTIPRKADGTPDTSYFAYDCFHLSKKGQHAMANALWNNMLEAGSLDGDGEKDDSWDGPKEQFHCPSANSYLWVPPRV